MLAYSTAKVLVGRSRGRRAGFEHFEGDDEGEGVGSTSVDPRIVSGESSAPVSHQPGRAG